MARFTYFVMTPGVDRRSYMKFGDSEHDHDDLGIRNAYRTHNPDIGVAAVMDSTAVNNQLLGTRLKQVMINAGYQPVQGAI